MLEAQVDDDGAALGHRPRPLERGDRLADTGLAAEQHDLAVADPAAEHLVERVEAGGEHGLLRRRGLELVQLGERGERGADVGASDDEVGDGCRHRQLRNEFMSTPTGPITCAAADGRPGLMRG